MTAPLEQIVADEMRQWDIGGVALALVDDQRVVEAAGFGQARRDSVFRVGSISKLFNAIAVMQQVQDGKLDLDAPLPADVLPCNRFPGSPPITLRHTLCHRSGLPRESAVGGYFDDSEPGLAATVASIRLGALVTPPGAKTRYSNIAPSIAGLMVERAAGFSFEDYQRRRVLDPLAMADSAWSRARAPRDRLIPSRMRVADGHGGWLLQPAPLFDLGTIPAGNLFSTVDDLARFASALHAGGSPLVKQETLGEMWRVQFPSDTPPVFGLGFAISQWRGHRLVSHNGAVYGCTSSFLLLPDLKLAAIVLANEDIVPGRTRRIAEAGLAQLLESRTGEKSPPPETFPPPANLATLAGDYESQSFWARLEVRDSQLTGEISGQPVLFTPAGGLNFAAHSRLDDATPVTFRPNGSGAASGFTMGPRHFRKIPGVLPPLPPLFQSFCGSYGPDFIPLIISERNGNLHAMTENMYDYRLCPRARCVFELPEGMYTGDCAVFLTEAEGWPPAVNFAGMILPRRKTT